MSEGQFKKRLYDIRKYDLGEFDGGGYFFSTEKMLKVLDEAKAELPTNEDAIWRAKTEGGNLSADNIARCRWFLYQIWAEKWFGK